MSQVQSKSILGTPNVRKIKNLQSGAQLQVDFL